MAADMLAVYYERGEDSSALFDSLEISKSDSYKLHRNQYDVLKINMQEFLSMTHSIDDMIAMLQKYLIFDLKDHFADVQFRDEDNLIQVMKDIYSKTKCAFVILRVWLKDKDYVALAYMTGILPVKKYGSHSALNMFTEYSMTDPGDLAEYFGFTEQETAFLCEKYEMNFDEAKTWYDGYQLLVHRQAGNQYYSIYNPKSVVEAMMRHKFGTYWNQTETYEALKIYIQMDMDGLKDSVIKMLAGECVQVNVGTFSNDMTTFATKDDVLTLLVHLGYLTYDSTNETVRIPNKEVSQEYVNAISTMNWYGVAESVEDSRKLLEALWALDEESVADGIAKAHEEISIIQYNDENSLSCTINLAFYFAREYYTMVRELPAGKVLLVGINYNKTTKKHECLIEIIEK